MVFQWITTSFDVGFNAKRDLGTVVSNVLYVKDGKTEAALDEGGCLES